jgi:DNA repair protein RadC
MKTNKVFESVVKYNGNSVNQFKVTSSKEVFEHLHEIYAECETEVKEYCFALYFNNALKLVSYLKIGEGGTVGCVMDKKLIFKGALDCLAHGIILTHNHPSGTLRPSAQDKTITTELKKGGDTLDIKILDHIIYTKEGYYSLADEGDI